MILEVVVDIGHQQSEQNPAPQFSEVLSNLGTVLTNGIDTVTNHLATAERASLSWPLPTELDEATLATKLWPLISAGEVKFVTPGFAYIHEQLKQKARNCSLTIAVPLSPGSTSLTGKQGAQIFAATHTGRVNSQKQEGSEAHFQHVASKTSRFRIHCAKTDCWLKSVISNGNWDHLSSYI